MNITRPYSEDDRKKDLWVQAWIAVATSESCKAINIPAVWADRLLDDYNRRF